ncbi:hypothetical protein Ancab_007990 [Ancistrocladus abbreviatus]
MLSASTVPLTFQQASHPPINHFLKARADDLPMAHSGAQEWNQDLQCIHFPRQPSPFASWSKESSLLPVKHSATQKGAFLNSSDCNDDSCSSQSGFGQALYNEIARPNFEEPTTVGALGDRNVSPSWEQHKCTLMEDGTPLLKRREASDIVDSCHVVSRDDQVLGPTILGQAHCGHASGHSNKPTRRAFNSHQAIGLRPKVIGAKQTKPRNCSTLTTPKRLGIINPSLIQLRKEISSSSEQ